ncbi:MAG: hypothetical protein EKK63_10970 [Acinetobacter sp.]|uniref:hypothetical protein n=1 Tax=Acinetobacter sp. TaxID=472 RepID=UPI000F91F193|nr:hypothetical protein [Acinetobacter sp.]RUP38888.1 MAG: hypothetical protein EKK63_10970 [Acinetobacter sp.]
MSARDFQRTKFYNWCRTIPSADIAYNDIEDVIKSIISDYGFNHPKFVDKCARSIYNPRVGIIIDFRLESMSSHDACCLAAWYLKHKMAPNEAWHGETFCKIFAEASAKLTSTPVQDIVKSMRAAKLKVAGEARPVGARILKRYETSKNRVKELEDAINRGRQEFEQFLQPILKELEKSRLELNILEEKVRK